MKSILILLICFFLVFDISVSCGQTAVTPFQKDKINNIIIISITNVGSEHMSLYGYGRKTTPNIDKFARNAFVFDNNFSVSSWTLPVAVSFFTSKYPYTHKVMYRFSGNQLGYRQNKITLSSILKSCGYKTAAFTGGMDYTGVFGLSRGFDCYNRSRKEYNRSTRNFAGFAETLPKAKDWLKDNKNGRFFLFIQGYDSHAPFAPPDEFRRRFSDVNYKPNVDTSQCIRGYEISEGADKYHAYYVQKRGEPVVQVELNKQDIMHLRDLYDAEVAYTDKLVGEFLSYLKEEKLLENTLVIIFSEHGEMFAKHGRFGRAGAVRGTYYNDVLHVPLIMRFPDMKGRRLKELSQIIDIMPTVLDWLGIPKSRQFQGRSLWPAIKEGKEVHKYVFAGSYFGRSHYIPYQHPSDMRAIYSKGWKLIHETVFTNDDKTVEEDIFELYNTKNDPDESINLAKKLDASSTKKFEELKQELLRWEQEVKNTGEAASTVSVPDELVDAAYKHGYW